ncbi:peptidase M15, partial [Bacillus cereus]
AQNVVTHPTSNDSVGVAYINGSNVNLRKGPGTGYGVIRQLGKGESYKVFGQTNGWLNLGGDQWVYNDPSY